MVNREVNPACVPPTRIIASQLVTSPSVRVDLCLFKPKIDSLVATLYIAR